jgi:hypothetical protein
MPNPNDPALEQQKRDLGEAIDRKEQEIADAEARGVDTAQHKQELKALETQMQQLQGQRKEAREQNRDNLDQSRGRSEEARANAPGQQRKNQ